MFDLPLQLRFHQRTLSRIGVGDTEFRRDLPAANLQPTFPYHLERIVHPRRFDDAAERFENLERALTQLEHARIERHLPAKIAGPSDSRSLEIALERSGKHARILANRKWRARVVPGNHR